MEEKSNQDLTAGSEAEKSRPLMIRLLPVLLLATGFAAFFVLGLDRYVDFEVLRDNRQALTNWVADAGWLAALVFILIYIVVVAVSIPGASLLTLTAGFLFGTLAATGYVVVGATLGATILFVAAKTALGDTLRQRLGPGFEKLQDGFNDDAFSYMLFLRLVPAFPFFLVNLAPAFMGIKLRTYFITTLVGIIPGTFVYASIGNGLGAIFETGGTPDLSIVTKPEIIVPVVGLGVLAILPVVVRKLRARSAAQGL